MGVINNVKMFFRKKKAPGVLRASDSYFCRSCGQTSSKEAWERNWDWSGPSCPNCGAGGMGVFADVIEQDCPGGIRGRKP